MFGCTVAQYCDFIGSPYAPRCTARGLHTATRDRQYLSLLITHLHVALMETTLVSCVNGVLIKRSEHPVFLFLLFASSLFSSHFAPDRCIAQGHHLCGAAESNNRLSERKERRYHCHTVAKNVKRLPIYTPTYVQKKRVYDHRATCLHRQWSLDL